MTLNNAPKPPNIANPENEDLSSIQKFFHGKVVFVTGGTGFLGFILLDKLLRSCPGIGQIFVMIRQKKGKDTNERFKSIFEDVLFERMKTECPNYLSLVTPVVGDCCQPDLGMSEQDQAMLREQVNIVFHCAATVRFDEHIKQAVSINIKATKDLLKLSRNMKQLQAFVHVSTAYSNCAGRKVVEENFYPPAVPPDVLISMADNIDQETLKNITNGLITPWPNTYSFTKAIAEEVVRTEGQGLPVTVVRPAIVIATANEPIRGWISNFYGPTGVVAGAGVGLIRSIHANGDCIADLVPCDLVVNATIAAAWDIANKKDNTEKSEEIPIYNYVSSNVRPLRWKEFMAYNELAEPEIPSTLAIWVYCLFVNKHKTVHQIYCFFLHLIPALIVDTCARIIGKEPKLWKAYQKVHKFSDVISYFSTKQWKFYDDNVRKLVDKLSEQDKQLFDFDISQLDWKQYFYHHIRGLRVYLTHDSLDTVPEGIKRRKKLMVAHYTVVSLFCFLMLYIAFKLLNLIFG